MRQFLRGAGAGAALVPGPGWIVGAGLALASFLVPEDMPDPNKIFLSGSEKMKWGEEGLSGHEGLLWDKYEQGIGSSPYYKGEDYIKQAVAEQFRTQGQWDENYRPRKTYDQRLGEYEAFQRGEYRNTIPADDFGGLPRQDYYDWDVWKDHGFEAGTQAKSNIRPDRWVGGYGLDVGAVKDRPDPIKSAKYGDVYAWQDLHSQGAPILSIQDLYGGEFADKYYQPFSRSINTLTGGIIDVFNENVMEYLDTLPEAERANMVEKLSNADFSINYSDPSHEHGNIASEGFTKENPNAYGDYMVGITNIVSNDLIKQAEAIGIPKSAFFADSSDAPADAPADTPTTEDPKMADTRASQYMNYAQKQEGWDSEWDKYKDTLSAKLKDPSMDVTKPGEEYTAIPQSDWTKIAKFAEGLDPMSSDTWQGGDSGGVSYQTADDFLDPIKGYSFQDYWDRLEKRSAGQYDLYGEIGGKYEGLGKTLTEMYQTEKGRRDEAYGGYQSDLAAAREALESANAIRGTTVRLGGNSFLFDTGKKERREKANSLLQYLGMGDSMLNSISASEGNYADRKRANIGDIANAYRAQLDAPTSSYREFAPHVTRWEESAEREKDRQLQADMLLKQLASKERVAKMMQEGQDASLADYVSSVLTLGGGAAKLLGTDLGGGNTVLSYLGKGAGSLVKGIGSLFSDEITPGDVWSGDYSELPSLGDVFTPESFMDTDWYGGWDGYTFDGWSDSFGIG